MKEIYIFEKNLNLQSAQTLGNRVKSARLLAGYQSRVAFQQRHGISAATLKTWENPNEKRGGITKKGAMRFVQALKRDHVICSVEWLLTGNGEGPTLLRQNEGQIPKTEQQKMPIEFSNTSQIILRSDLEDVTSNLPLSQPKESYGLIFKGTFAVSSQVVKKLGLLRKENGTNIVSGRTFAIDPTIIFRVRQRTEIEVLCEISEQIAKLFAKYGKELTPSILMKLSLDIYTDIRFATDDKEKHFMMIKSFISSFERGLKLD